MIADAYKKEFKPIPAFNGKYLMNKNGAVVDINFNLCQGYFSAKTLRLTYVLEGETYTYKQLYESVFPEVLKYLKVKTTDVFKIPVVED